MEVSPPIKPPRGVKPVKETSGLLMSVIRTLSASETNEQRDKEKSKLESEYKSCDKKLDELVSKHEEDLSKVMQLFAMISQVVSDNRLKIAKVKENLQDCKKKLRCRRDELRNLWLEGLEYKYMLQLLEEIEKMSEVPDRLASYMNCKQYLHATELLVEAVTLGKNTLEGVESLKELSRELEQKKEQLHVQLFTELKEHLFSRPAQHILALRRQESGRDNFMMNSPLQRSIELRLSSRSSNAVRRNIFETSPRFTINIQDVPELAHDNLIAYTGVKIKTKFERVNVQGRWVFKWLENVKDKLDNFHVEEDLNNTNPEENSFHFIIILIKCLALLDKLPFAVNRIKDEIQIYLLTIIQRTTQHMKDFAGLQNESDYKHALKELIQTLFAQFKEVAEANAVFLRNVEEAAKAHKSQVKTYNMIFYWNQVQCVFESFLNEYLDIQNISNESQVINTSDGNDLSSYFGRRKQTAKKKSLFKFDSSSSALTLSSTLKSNKKDKIVVCKPHSNNILIIFIPFMCFIEDIEQLMDVPHGSCQLYRFITQYVSDIYLKRKSDEIIDQIEAAVRATDAWKATVLLDCTADYKPLLISTVSVERCIREWRAVLQALPLYSERIAVYSCKALKEYKDTCFAAYQGIVQPHSEDRRICSAAWLKDEDISRFLKSLPNWLNLKAQQEYQARSERIRRVLRRDQRSEEESPEDVRMRNRREAEILASNLGEGGVSAAEILSDMSLLKELAQLQESMEWFSVRMFQYTSEFRQEPSASSPSKNDGENVECSTPVSATVLQQLTSIAQEFDELANTCLLLLHLEVRVQCFHYLLAQTHYNKETHEPDPKVLELSRVLANVDEAVTSSLHPRKCKYIFEGLGHLIAKILISSAQYLQTIDEAGIQRMCRNIFALQQTLTNITMTRELALDHARHYFELFFLSPEEILNGIVEKGPEFSELEYMNAFQLLNRSQNERDLGSVAVHLERLSDILGEVGMTV